MAQWFEYVSVYLPKQIVSRAEVECETVEEFYALLNHWNRNDALSCQWKFYSPTDWGNHKLQGRVFNQRKIKQ